MATFHAEARRRLAREGALDKLGPALGAGFPGGSMDVRPRRQPLQIFLFTEHFGVAAFAATNPFALFSPRKARG
jgi:hypothetical protein